jgi:hypothetical protein
MPQAVLSSILPNGMSAATADRHPDGVTPRWGRRFEDAPGVPTHNSAGADHLVRTQGSIDTLLLGAAQRRDSISKEAVAMSAILWFLLAALYVVVLITLGVTTLRKGHAILFVFGIIFPFLWIIGALIGPTPRVAGAR